MTSGVKSGLIQAVLSTGDHAVLNLIERVSDTLHWYANIRDVRKKRKHLRELNTLLMGFILHPEMGQLIERVDEEFLTSVVVPSLPHRAGICVSTLALHREEVRESVGLFTHSLADTRVILRIQFEEIMRRPPQQVVERALTHVLGLKKLTQVSLVAIIFCCAIATIPVVIYMPMEVAVLFILCGFLWGVGWCIRYYLLCKKLSAALIDLRAYDNTNFSAHEFLDALGMEHSYRGRFIRHSVRTD